MANGLTANDALLQACTYSTKQVLYVVRVILQLILTLLVGMRYCIQDQLRHIKTRKKMCTLILSKALEHAGPSIQAFKFGPFPGFGRCQEEMRPSLTAAN